MKPISLASVLASATVALVAGGGCSDDKPAAAATAPTIVTVSEPLVRKVVEAERFTGRLDASESVNLQPRVTGYLDAINFKPGQDVKRGDLLFEIDPRPYQAELDRANGEAAVNQAALQLAVADNNRNKALAKRSPGAVTQQDLDKYAAIEAQAGAQLKASQANAESAALNLKFAKIDAPISGKISKSSLNVGNLVNANTTVLANLVAVDPIYANFDVDEATVLRLEALVREGKLAARAADEVPVYLGLTGDDDFPYRGTVNYVDPRVDSATGTRRVRAEFSNKQGILSPGLFAKIKVPLGNPRQALLVTERALGTDQGQKFVYVVNANKKVEYRLVAVGVLENGLRVINNGLKSGEWVIVNGVQRVRPGMTVDAQPAPMPELPATETAAPAASVKATRSDAQK